MAIRAQESQRLTIRSKEVTLSKSFSSAAHLAALRWRDKLKATLRIVTGSEKSDASVSLYPQQIERTKR